MNSITTYLCSIVSSVAAANCVKSPIRHSQRAGHNSGPYSPGIFPWQVFNYHVQNQKNNATSHSYELALEGVKPLIAKVWRYCEANSISGKTLTLKVKYSDFNQITRSKSIAQGFQSPAAIEETIAALLESAFPTRKGVRLLGLTMSSLEPWTAGTMQQLTLTL
ncbi:MULTISPECIES: hypothetical protein [unclassified Rhizobium]|uniref:DinB/UmuC family translesion DNA polymerase n=1 Tax=unclassified Rhizobium TaxID=2613769 RepID=UPI00161CEEF1|nr:MULTISPECIES: hypothetical protein [unclassified Rhizobium]